MPTHTDPGMLASLARKAMRMSAPVVGEDKHLAVPGGMAAILTRPQGLLDRARWRFLLVALCGTAILTPFLVLIAPSAWPLKVAAAAGLAGLGWRWIHAYRQGHL